MIIAAVRFIPESPRASGRFDFTGAVASTLGMGALVFAIVNSVDAGWAAPEQPWIVAALLLGLLVLNEWKVKQPMRCTSSPAGNGAGAARPSSPRL